MNGPCVATAGKMGASGGNHVTRRSTEVRNQGRSDLKKQGLEVSSSFSSLISMR